MTKHAEKWLPIDDFPGYFVSDQGRVRSTVPFRHQPGVRILTATINSHGYPVVRMTRERREQTRPVHKLVALAFLGPRPDRLDTRHLDGDKTNNAVSNLAYGTRSENELDKVAHGTHHHANKTHCPQDHPYDASNTKWYRGRRYCRACHNERGRTRRAALRVTRDASSA